VIRSDVEHLAKPIDGARGREQAAARIFNISEIARCRQIAEETSCDPPPAA
jgi:hypothetical protein